jgi:hypothetical protein
MIQHYIKNHEYEILTPNGWENFEGVIFNQDANKSARKIIFQDDTFIIATRDHRFIADSKEVVVSTLKVGDKLNSGTGSKIIKDIHDTVLQNTYEIFNAENHVIFVNEIHSHQCDELSYVEPNIAKEFWTSISPTLATGGKALITSTPNSDEDQFAEIWHAANKRFDAYGNEQELGENGFFPYLATWNRHPDRDQKWAAEEMSRIGAEKFEREHDCRFVVFEETLISSLKLAEMSGIDPMMKMGQARWYKKIDPRCTYVISLDPSLGTGGDFAAIQVLEVPSLIQVCEWNHNTTPVQSQVRIMRDICKYINEICLQAGASSSIYYSVENNTVGEAALVAISEIGEETIPGLFLSEPIKKGHVRRFRKGFNTTHNAKIAACAKLKQLIETKKLTVNSKNLISELKTFVSQGISFAGKARSHDDLVMSMLLAVRMILILQDWDASIYEMIRETTGEIDDYDLPMPFIISSH